jgi:DNA-binding response OmpR family regulator
VSLDTVPPPHRILVVDDNVDATECLALFLSLQGHDVQTAFDGVQAIEKADQFRPNVIVIDIGLPVVDGHDAGRRIRQFAWAQRATLIALSGWGHDEDQQKSRAAGFDHHLVKPVNLTVLSEILASIEPVDARTMAAHL